MTNAANKALGLDSIAGRLGVGAKEEIAVSISNGSDSDCAASVSAG